MHDIFAEGDDPTKQFMEQHFPPMSPSAESATLPEEGVSLSLGPSTAYVPSSMTFTTPITTVKPIRDLEWDIAHQVLHRADNQ